MAQQKTEYGFRGGNKYNVPYPIGASEVFKKAGGGFLIDDTSGRLEIALAASTRIVGHVDNFTEDFTASSTEGATVLPVNVMLEAIYELPINAGTYATTMRGETTDLSISSSIQGVNLAASAVDVIEIVDAGYTDPSDNSVDSVLVKLFIGNLTRTGVV